MSLLPGLRAFLLANEPITDIVGARIHYKILPQTNEPYPENFVALSYFRVSPLAYLTHDRKVGGRRERIQFDCWGVRKSNVDNLSETLFYELAVFRGPMGTVLVDGCIFQGGLELPDDFIIQTTTRELQRVTMDFMIWWRFAPSPV